MRGHSRRCLHPAQRRPAIYYTYDLIVKFRTLERAIQIVCLPPGGGRMAISELSWAGNRDRVRSTSIEEDVTLSRHSI